MTASVWTRIILPADLLEEHLNADPLFMGQFEEIKEDVVTDEDEYYDDDVRLIMLSGDEVHRGKFTFENKLQEKKIPYDKEWGQDVDVLPGQECYGINELGEWELRSWLEIDEGKISIHDIRSIFNQNISDQEKVKLAQLAMLNVEEKRKPIDFAAQLALIEKIKLKSKLKSHNQSCFESGPSL